MSLHRSIVSSEEIVASLGCFSLSSHPVSHHEGGEEGDEGGVNAANTETPDVEGPTDDPVV